MPGDVRYCAQIAITDSLAGSLSVTSGYRTDRKNTATHSCSWTWTPSNEPIVTNASTQTPANPELFAGDVWQVSSNFIFDALMYSAYCGIPVAVSRRLFWTKLNEAVAWSRYVLFEPRGMDSVNMLERLRNGSHVSALGHTGKWQDGHNEVPWERLVSVPRLNALQVMTLTVCRMKTGTLRFSWRSMQN